MKTLALILFLLMYILMIALPKHRPLWALGTAAVFLLAGILPAGSLFSVINWNVLLMIGGTMILVDFFIDSGMPNLLADLLMECCSNVMWITISMSLFAGFISAFIDNVATVMMVAPVGLAACRKLDIDPVGMVLSIAVSSNLQGAATLVGDTTSIMLGDYAGMNFTDFFWMKGRPGIFFAVELGALVTVPVMMLLFRKESDLILVRKRTPVTHYMPTVMLLLMLASLIAASFVPEAPPLTNGVICCVLAGAAMLLGAPGKTRMSTAAKAVMNLDFETLGMLLGLFAVIGGLTETGLVKDLADLIVRLGGGNLFLLYTLIVWGSVLISAFVDNIPYVATMLPVLSAVSEGLGAEPELLYFGLLSGATLGGNITPIGASANIAATGLLKKAGCEVSFPAFMRIGLPYTLAAVTAAYVFLWLVWG